MNAEAKRKRKERRKQAARDRARAGGARPARRLGVCRRCKKATSVQDGGQSDQYGVWLCAKCDSRLGRKYGGEGGIASTVSALKQRLEAKRQAVLRGGPPNPFRSGSGSGVDD